MFRNIVKLLMSLSLSMSLGICGASALGQNQTNSNQKVPPQGPGAKGSRPKPAPTPDTGGAARGTQPAQQNGGGGNRPPAASATPPRPVVRRSATVVNKPRARVRRKSARAPDDDDPFDAVGSERQKFPKVVIITDPPGTTVWIDGLSQGKTLPDGTLEITDLPPQVYPIALTKEGYISEEGQIEVKALNPEPKKFILKASLRDLNVTTKPGEVEVSLDDVRQGVSSKEGALVIKNVNPMVEHKLRGNKLGYNENIATVGFNVRTAAIELLTNSIALKVRTEPGEVNIYLDDGAKGTSSPEGVLVIEQVNPLEPHKLRASKPGYRLERVEVLPNVAEVKVTLLPDPILVTIKDTQQHIRAGRLSKALEGYTHLAREAPDNPDMPRLLDDIVQRLHALSSDFLSRTGPRGLSISFEDAQNMHNLYEQARKWQREDVMLEGYAEYWAVKYLLVQSHRPEFAGEREALMFEAQAAAQRLGARNLRNAFISFDLGWIFSRVSNDDAVRYYREAQSLNPTWAYPFFALGSVEMQAAQKEVAKIPKGLYYDRAISNFTKAINLKPDLFEAYELLGFACAVLNRHPEAINNGQQLVTLRPQSARAHYALGFAYYQQGSQKDKKVLRTALSEFELALTLKDDGFNPQVKDEIPLKIAAIKKSLGIKPDK